MSSYDLGYDEIVILQDSNVKSNGVEVTLILTNQHIIQIQVDKHYRREDRQVWKYPLLALKEMNGSPNVRIGKAYNGDTQLELYFRGYEKVYSFHGLFAERKWLNAIEKAYKTAVADKKKSAKGKSNLEKIYASVKDTLSKQNSKETADSIPKESKPKTIKCPRCGAELVGKTGSKLRCSYCETVVEIN